MPGVTTSYQSGVHGSRPAANSGCILYACSTHSLIYRSDGTTWTTWMTIGSSTTTVASDAIWDAKGDLAVGTGADTAAKLTAGANDTILMAESGETTGLKWVASQTPSTQAFGDAAAEGTADTYARGDHKHAMPASPGGGVSSCLAQRTTSQSTGSNPTAIAFNATDLYDPDGWHDPASNNTRLTCPTGKGGKMFTMSGSAEWDGSGSSSCYIMFRKNGTTTVGQNLIPQNAYTGTASAPVFLNDGDYVEMLIANVTTGNVIVSDAPCTFGIVG